MGSLPLKQVMTLFVFCWWMGDDVDATIVIDDEGFLYVAAEYERLLLDHEKSVS